MIFDHRLPHLFCLGDSDAMVAITVLCDDREYLSGIKSRTQELLRSAGFLSTFENREEPSAPAPALCVNHGMVTTDPRSNRTECQEAEADMVDDILDGI